VDRPEVEIQIKRSRKQSKGEAMAVGMEKETD
jgi:hypothetical protein